MDIAKIRKKAKEKEKKDAGKFPPKPEETRGEKSEEGGQAPSEEAVSLPPEAVEEPEDIAGDTDISSSSPTAVADLPAEEPRKREQEAPSSEAGKVGEAIVELLTFSLSTEEFAFRVSQVEEIIRYQPITKVPTMPDYVLGITSLRGKIMPVIDLKTRIVFRGVRAGGAAAAAGNPDGKGKILILLGPRGPIGVTIDRVQGVVRLQQNGILEPPAHLLEEERKFVDGVVILDKRFVSIVRCEEALKIEVT